MTDRELLELLVQKVSGLENQITDIQSELGGVNSRLDILENQNTDIRSELNGVNSTLDNLENQNRDIRSELSSFRAEANLKLDILQNQSDIIAKHVLMHTETLEEIADNTVSIHEIVSDQDVQITVRRKSIKKI